MRGTSLPPQKKKSGFRRLFSVPISGIFKIPDPVPHLLVKDKDPVLPVKSQAHGKGLGLLKILGLEKGVKPLPGAFSFSLMI